MNNENEPPPLAAKQEQAMTLFFDGIIRVVETLDAERKVYDKLLEQQVAIRGTILTYHLITEQLITQELARLQSFNSIVLKKRLDKMVYAEKLQALPRQIAYASIRKGLKELNQIRNKMAHDLSFLPSLTDIPIVVACIAPFFDELPNRRPKSVEENLQFFLKLCIGIFASRSGNARVEIDKFIQTFPGTQKLLKRLIE